MKTAALFGTALVLALALSGCANPADDVPAADVAQEAAAPAPDAVPSPSQTRVFEVAEGSTISFVGSKITGSHDGGFHGFEGTVTLVDGDPEKSSVNLSIDTTTIWTDSERLTGHLKSPDFFEVETYPSATFTSTAIARTEDGYRVTGNLTLHGTTKSISFPATIEAGPDRVTAKAEFSLKRFDFNIVYPGKPDDLIRDEVVVRLDIVALPAAGA